MARSANKRLTTRVVQLDLRDLKAHGWSLTLPGGSRAERLDEHVLIDLYGKRFIVSVTQTTPQYGGRRFWFRCRQCGRRARIVYSPDFDCRHCSGLVHPSTRQTTAERAIRRAVQVRSELGGSGSLLQPRLKSYRRDLEGFKGDAPRPLAEAYDHGLDANEITGRQLGITVRPSNASGNAQFAYSGRLPRCHFCVTERYRLQRRRGRKGAAAPSPAPAPISSE